MNWSQTYITLIKGFVCTGILYLPTAYWNGGYIFSIVALFLAYVLTIVCGMKLIEVSRLDAYKGMSFSEIGEALYGRKGRLGADAAIIGSQVGFVTAYIAFISDSLGEIIKEATNADHKPSPWYFGILCAVIYIPLCWVRKI